MYPRLAWGVRSQSHAAHKAVMRLLPPQQIRSWAADPARCTQAVATEAIDSSRPFIHEDYTQLYYTPLYQRLSYEQRLTYNQLFAVRTNEYIMMLEHDFVERILLPLRHHPEVARQADLADCLEGMIDEERRHYQLFLDLNRRSLPGVFAAGRERYFSQLPWRIEATFSLLGLLARRFAFPLWYFTAMEEASVALARSMIKQPTTESLGALEPHWVAVHREHAKDEARHLHIDVHLIDSCIGTAGPIVRRIDAASFQRMLGGITHPQRSGSGVKVIHHLVQTRQELEPLKEEMIAAVLALKDHPAYQRSLFNRTAMPLTFGIFDSTPELAGLPAHMVGYERE